MQETIVAVAEQEPEPAAEGAALGTLVRKLVIQVDDLEREAGRDVPHAPRRVVVAGVVANPWVGRRVDDLSREVEEILEPLAPALIDRLLRHIGGAAEVRAFGKGALVGVGGEVEHGAALIHTPHLGDRFRGAVGGTSIIAFGEVRAEPGAALSIPMWHTREAATRSHYQSAEIRISDAPRADEIVIAIAASSGPRPFARIGDRRTDPSARTRKDRP
ncbi:MAG TPA: amino acid synthesis family protein [Solirubrobacteraceae bacterium]|nr:amino acid synthesis family protein [Solirubrobacteraceae bacterium]